MANNNATTNLKLTLPVEENINWAGTINDNFEKIDDAVGKIEKKYTTLVNTNIDNAAIFIDDKVTAVNFANNPNTNQLILGNIGTNGFTQEGTATLSNEYVNFTKGRCFYVYCGPGDNASYKGNENNMAPYNMDWANGDIMVFDKEYRNGQYQVSFRKMPQVLGKKYLNQYSTSHYFTERDGRPGTDLDWFSHKFEGYVKPKTETGASAFPNINCDLYYCNDSGSKWEKIATDYIITQERGSSDVTLKVHCDQTLDAGYGILAVLYYRV